jgi:site-specific recombinase XerD
MFEQLFTYPGVLARHRGAPAAAARENYLQHCAKQGMARGTLLSVANELRVIAGRLEIAGDKPIAHEEIRSAAERWARSQRRRGRSAQLRWSRERFVQVAIDWLSFLNRLEIKAISRPKCIELSDQFLLYLREERGLSPRTIQAYRWHVETFLRNLAAQGRPFSKVTLADTDAFLASLRERNWCRVSLATAVKALRGFFRYAAQRRWCSATIATGLMGPRLFREEGLPVGPAWSDIERLVNSTTGNTRRDVRDSAILQLFAVYGFRSGEVAALRLEDLNWAQDRICLKRSKQRSSQEYPLLASVGEAILRYLERARPPSARREVFLTLRAPIGPLSAGAMYHLVSTRLRKLEISSLRRGPHALRHACAGHLVTHGLALKEIGDHLGHRSAYATRTYAKVDLVGLREVAQFNLGDLL